MFVASDFGLTVTPIFIESMDYPTPIVIPHTNSSNVVDFGVNYMYQFVVILDAIIFLSIHGLTFIFFTSHIVIEIKVICEALEKLGYREEEQYLKELKYELERPKPPKKPQRIQTAPVTQKNQRELDLELLNEIYEELTNDPPPALFASNLQPKPTIVISEPHDLEKKLKEEKMLNEAKEILFEKGMEINQNYEKSSEILKNVVIMHNDILRQDYIKTSLKFTFNF